MMPATTTRKPQVPSPLLFAIFSAVGAGRAPADTATLLRQAGYDAGEDLYAMLREYVAEGESGASLDHLPAPQFWEAFISFWGTLGWGRLEQSQVHQGVAELVSGDWVEAETTLDRLGCQLTTGLLADLFARLASDELAVLEVECRSRGDSRCRFLIGSPTTLDAVYDQLRQGTLPDDALSQLR
jgi:predicted hydrocarbon binding protein